MAFRDDFVWGSATASFQVEGAWNEDGKQPSIWDVFCHEGKHIADSSSGDVACDHYHRYKADVALMAELGLKAYRFSITWTRIFTFDGVTEGGEACYHENQAGIAFYSNLIDELLAHGIEPYVTLYHWDLPLALQRQGGWLNRAITNWFADYARVCAKYFGERVKHFTTFNEPSVFVGCGYMLGTHAPGSKLDTSDLLTVWHNVLLAHGKAVRAIRKAAPSCKIGITLASSPVIPTLDGKPVSLTAATRALQGSDSVVTEARDRYFYCGIDNFMWAESAWVDPIALGRYPEGLMKACHAQDGETVAVVFSAEDLAVISSPIDFIGLNIYTGRYLGEEKAPQGCAHTDMGWRITPEALSWGPAFFYDRYKKPIYITENGMACQDWISSDSAVHDSARIDFLHRYLLALRDAADAGCDIRGYFQWSFLDNFEWAEGYTKRFGMVYCDYQTCERTPKDSAAWYSQVIKANGSNL